MKRHKPHADHDNPGYAVIEITPVVQKQVKIGTRLELQDDYVGTPYIYKVPRNRRKQAEAELRTNDVKYRVVSM